MTPMELFLYAVAIACGVLVIGAAILILLIVLMAILGAVRQA
jgi:hypothetical protein